MTGVASSSSRYDATRGGQVSLRARLLIYCGVWVLAALVSLLIPDNDFTFSEKVEGALLTPLVAAFGLSLVVTFPNQPTELIVLFVVTALVVCAVATLIQTRRSVFYILVGGHIVVLSIATVYLIRFSNLPSGP